MSRQGPRGQEPASGDASPEPPGRPARSGEASRSLLALAETVARSLALDEVLDRIVLEVERLFDARAVWIRLLDDASGTLRVRAARGRGLSEVLGLDLRPGQGIGGAVFERQTIEAVPQMSRDPRALNARAFAEAGIDEAIFVPLVAAGRSIGVLAYCPRGGRAAHDPPSEFGLLSLFAAHAAVAIRHAATRAEAVAARDRAERTARRLAAIQRLEEAIGLTDDLSSLLGRTASLAAVALGGRYGAVALLDPSEHGPRERARGHLVLGTATADCADLPWRGLPLGRRATVLAPLAARRRALLIDEPGKEAGLGPFRRFLAAPAAQQLLLAPVISGGRLLGALAVDDGAGRAPFRVDDLALAESLGARLGAAIDRIRLVEVERRRSRELLALQRTTQHLAATLSVPDLLPVVVEEAARLVEADAVVLRLREGDDLVLAAHSRGVAGGQGLPRAVALGDPVEGLPASRNGPVTIPDLAREAGVRPVGPRARDFRSYVGVPIRAAGTIVGVLGFYSRRPRRFEPREAELAATLADVVAVALDNARLFERVSRGMREWETSFDAMREGIALIDADGRIVRANRALAEILERTAAELAGRPFAEVAPGLAPGREALRGGRSLAVSGSPLVGPDGRRFGDVYAVRDVTAERRLSEQLLQSEKLASIGQLVSGVAHELNNPLAAIIGYTELLLRQAGDTAQARDIEQVRGQAARASRIVHNLLSFARKHRPEKRDLSLNEVAQAVLELQGYDLRVSNIMVETDLDPELPRVMADFHQLEEVVVNVLVNAKQAILEARGEGLIRVTTRGVSRDNRPAARLTVGDNGPGIAGEHLHRVFDPFFTTKPVGVGTGLGLSICFGIVEEHGGRIWVESEPGTGTTVVIELPAVSEGARPGSRGEAPAADAEPASPAAAPPGPSTRTASRAAGTRVLVVDDEPTIRDVVSAMLRLDGYDVETADDGRAAVLRLSTAAFDAIIADVKMPGMGGLELADWIAANRPALRDRVVFMTGDLVGVSTRRLIETSRRPFVAKPFSHPDLTAALEATLACAPGTVDR